MREDFVDINAVFDDNVIDNIIRVGQRIKEERIRRNLTIAEVAEKAGINVSHLYRIENNEKTIGLRSLIHITRTFNCTVDTLIPHQTYLNKNINPNIKDEILCVNYCSKERLNEWYKNAIRKIGKRIKEEREKQHLPIEYVAKLLKISCKELECIEEGEQLITLEQFIGASMVLDEKLEAIMRYESCRESFVVLKRDLKETKFSEVSFEIDEIMHRIGCIVKDERKAQGLTVNELAQSSILNITQIYRIESGESFVGLKSLVKIAIVLKKPLDYFIVTGIKVETT